MLEKTNPGTTYIYGETGLREGGSFKPHKSHQNGLSVDFFVPVIDRAGTPKELSIGVSNQFGYAIEFDQRAQFENLKIDFESMARHIDALAVAAKKEGIGIEVVIFDKQFQPMLFASPTGRRLKGSVAFSVKKPWVRHDEHYHVNFAVPCRAKAGA